MARVPKHVAGKGGWSRWISPSMNQPYRLACCDCGLVHDMSFRVLKLIKRKGKTWSGKQVTGMKILFRARRNKRATSATRREDKRRAQGGRR